MKRIRVELPQCQQKGFDVTLPDTDNLMQWSVKLPGPAGSPYEGGAFLLDVAFPPTYPFKPPTVKFGTKIYHPNVDATSLEVCADAFNIGGSWAPTQKMTDVLALFSGALADPSPGETPLNTEAAAQYVEDRAAFDAEARKWTAEHAK